jgi:hypothetical protein
MIILKRTDSESLIAHEIAHAYLNYTKAKNKIDNQESRSRRIKEEMLFQEKTTLPNLP